MLQQPRAGNGAATGTAAIGRKSAARAALKVGQPSVVRRAIALLLNFPKAADKLDVEKLAGLSRPGIDLLQDLIETVQAEPNITTAGLLERWRHDPQGRHLGKLAAVEMPAGEEFDAAGELADCLTQLALASRRERIDFLIEKQKLNPLTEEEKSELRQIV
jgi:DNA primase